MSGRILTVTEDENCLYPRATVDRIMSPKIAIGGWPSCWIDLPVLRTQGLILVGPYANGNDNDRRAVRVEHLKTSPEPKSLDMPRHAKARSRSFIPAFCRRYALQAGEMWDLRRKAEQLDHLLSSLKPRCLISTSFHNALRGRARDVEAVFCFPAANWPPVRHLAGADREVAVCDFINANQRDGEPLRLGRGSPVANGENYLMLLDSLEAALPLEKSRICRTKHGTADIRLSEGLIGEIVTIVTKAAIAATDFGPTHQQGYHRRAAANVPISQRRN